MGNILQGMMGMLSRKKIVTPKADDFVTIARYASAQEKLKANPRVEAEMVTMGAIKTFVSAGGSDSQQLSIAGQVLSLTNGGSVTIPSGGSAGVTSIMAGTGVSVNQATGEVQISATPSTYDLACAQDGANVDIILTGSDESVNTVQLTAGTNITLTDAEGTVTIDAVSGVPAGDIEVTGCLDLTTVLEGVIFTASDSTRWKQTISPTGVPIYTQVV
jgi:hypothetical protein|tara:strand:- start:167 stop:817 length:651 start_codon:yes stop_codon:yes gene_type:complete